MPLERSFNKNRVWIREIWLFETVGALRTAAMAKALIGLGSLPIEKCILKVP